MIQVKVTKSDILTGTPKCPLSCPVANALDRAFATEGSQLYDLDFVYYIEVDCRLIKAPPEVVRFARHYDELDVNNGRVNVPETYRDVVKPFSFKLPALDSGEWLDRCGHCGEPCKVDERCSSCGGEVRE